MTFGAALAGSGSHAVAATGPKGIWLDQTKRGAIEIYDCGKALCGRVVWMKNPLKPSGKPVVDGRNPKTSLRTRTICGMKMMGGLRSTGARTWGDGWIYDPERGQEFSLKVTQRGADRLTVTGYILSPTFGKSFSWTRAPEDIGRCKPTVDAASAS